MCTRGAGTCRPPRRPPRHVATRPQALFYGPYIYLLEFDLHKLKMVDVWDPKDNWRKDASTDGVYAPPEIDSDQPYPDNQVDWPRSCARAPHSPPPRTLSCQGTSNLCSSAPLPPRTSFACVAALSAPCGSSGAGAGARCCLHALL